jgi:hypothetical protein
MRQISGETIPQSKYFLIELVGPSFLAKYNTVSVSTTTTQKGASRTGLKIPLKASDTWEDAIQHKMGAYSFVEVQLHASHLLKQFPKTTDINQ